MIEKNGFNFHLQAKYAAIRVIKCAVVPFYELVTRKGWKPRRPYIEEFYEFHPNKKPSFSRNFPQKLMVLWACQSKKSV